MQNLLLSIRNDTLKVSINTKEGFKKTETQLSSEIVNDTKIIDSSALARKINEVINQFRLKKNTYEAVFLVEPQDIILKFLTLSKTNGSEDIDRLLIESAKSKLENINLDELYFSYQKVAPFVYQFVAVKKAHLEGYLDTATKAGLSVKAVVPWVLALPKFLVSKDSCIFILGVDGKRSVALAELNGIYYNEAFDISNGTDSLEDLIKDLSIYKRDRPIKKVYTLTQEDLDLGKNYDISPLVVLIDDLLEAAGYEIHLLVEEVLGSNPAYLQAQLNLLTLLPLPLVEKKNNALVYVGGLAILALALVGGFFFFNRNSNNNGDSDDLASDSQNGSQVLGDQGAPQSTESEPSTEESQETPQEELKKEELTIRIENGAGIQGIAAEAQAFLEEKGWTVLEIGNAEEIGRANTLLRLKPSKADYKDLLVEDMSSDYDVETIEDLEEEVEYDVLIVVGLN